MTVQDKEKFIQGFNEGYLIAAQNPLIARYVIQAEFRAPRIDGFRAGWLQYQKEQAAANPDYHFDNPLQNDFNWKGNP